MTDTIVTRANGRRVLKDIAPKAKTNGARVDELIALFEQLSAEANAVLDDYIETTLRPKCPSLPAGVIKQCGFTAPAGFAPNLAEALRILKRGNT